MTVDIKQLDEAVHVLLQARLNLTDAKAAWQEKQKAIDESPEKAAYDLAKDVENTASTNVRTMATEIYQETGEKHLHEAVDIKLTTQYEVDWEKALEWCRTEMPAMLVVDQKAFLQYAKASMRNLPFISETENVTPLIATNIAKAIARGVD
jgi:hypothetical protein